MQRIESTGELASADCVKEKQMDYSWRGWCAGHSDHRQSLMSFGKICGCYSKSRGKLWRVLDHAVIGLAISESRMLAVCQMC